MKICPFFNGCKKSTEDGSNLSIEKTPNVKKINSVASLGRGVLVMVSNFRLEKGHFFQIIMLRQQRVLIVMFIKILIYAIVKKLLVISVFF